MKQSGLGIASFVLGILAIILTCSGVGSFVGVLGFIFSIIALTRKNRKYGLAIAGMTCSLAAIVIFVVLLAISDLDETSDSSDSLDYVQETQIPTVESEETELEEGTKLKKPYIIWKGNDCKIKVVSCDNESAKLKIVNKSKKDYSFDVHAMALNGVMTGCNIYLSSTSVPSGKKAMMDIAFDENWIGDDDVKYVDLLIWAYDNAESMKDFDTGIIRIETNKYKKDRKFKSEQDAIEQNGISVFKRSITDSTISYSMINHNKYFVETSLENCSINDWAFEPEYSFLESSDSYIASLDGYGVIIFPNCIANVDVDISDFMQENNESSVNDFEFSLQVLPNEDYFKEEHTDKIVFKNKY